MENLKLTLENQTGNEVVLRTGAAKEIFVFQGITKTSLTISSLFEWISKTEIDIKDCFVNMIFNKNVVQFHQNFSKEDATFLEATLLKSKELQKFNINSDKKYSPFALSKFIRMHRHFFESKDQAIVLETALKNFEAKIDSELSAMQDTRGNKKHSAYQKVVTNIPLDFVIKVPVFEGEKPIKIHVEIDIDPDTLECVLVSPSLNELEENIVKECFENFEKDVFGLHPEMRILKSF